MTQWTKDKADSWYGKQPWLVGCNFLPSSAINQLEMFQDETFDIDLINKEIGWAKDLGFNSLRVYLHDLLWDDPNNFSNKLDTFLDVCSTNSIKPILVLFDDCHRPYPKKGRQPLPVTGVHNSGWKQSPGMELVHAIHDETITPAELIRLETFVKGILKKYKIDKIAAIESRGFVFASAVSYLMKKPFILLRKKNKLPGDTYSVDFQLEYGTATIEVHKDSIDKNDSVLIIDDLIATGGTAEAAARLVEMSKGKVAAFIFVINLFDLGGCKNLIKKGYKVENLMEFPGH